MEKIKIEEYATAAKEDIEIGELAPSEPLKNEYTNKLEDMSAQTPLQAQSPIEEHD